MNPNPVTLDPSFLGIGPYDLDEFEPLLQYEPPGGRETTRRAVASSLLPLPPRPPYLDAYAPDPSFLEVFRPADANVIADQCGQLGHMRATLGVMPEPVWYACIGVLAFCGKEGQALAHEWSKGDSRYSEAETQRKIEQCERLTGATLCSRFLEIGDDEARARCEACPHKGKISSPIHLGARVAPQEGEVEGVPTRRDLIQGINKKHFLIRNIGRKCMVGEMLPNPTGTGQMLSLQSVEAFKTWYANRFVLVPDGQGESRRKPLGAYWLQHRDRREYEGVALIPNAPEEINGTLNLWRGFGVKPKPGTWTLMFRHVCDVLAAGDPKATEYILRWAA